jgi:hypothetical protein
MFDNTKSDASTDFVYVNLFRNIYSAKHITYYFYIDIEIPSNSQLFNIIVT